MVPAQTHCVDGGAGVEGSPLHPSIRPKVRAYGQAGPAPLCGSAGAAQGSHLKHPDLCRCLDPHQHRSTRDLYCPYCSARRAHHRACMRQDPRARASALSWRSSAVLRWFMAFRPSGPGDILWIKGDTTLALGFWVSLSAPGSCAGSSATAKGGECVVLSWVAVLPCSPCALAGCRFCLWLVCGLWKPCFWVLPAPP